MDDFDICRRLRRNRQVLQGQERLGLLHLQLRAIAWVTDEDTNHGSAKVYIDGTLKTTVNTHNPASKDRVVVYKYGWASDGTHTIKIVNVATKNHPRITI